MTYNPYNIYYPSKNFLHDSMRVCNEEKDFIINILPNWRAKIIIKKIDILPITFIQSKEIKEGKRKAKTLPYLMMLCPALINIHLAAVDNGYVVSCKKYEEILKILYKFCPESKLQSKQEV